MKMTIEFELDDPYDGRTRQVEVNAEYQPGRPAPRCCNPDHSEFADPGEPSEVFIVRASYEDGNPVEPALVQSDVFRDHVLRAADESYAKGEI